jgi:signal transduction histidine kinase
MTGTTIRIPAATRAAPGRAVPEPAVTSRPQQVLELACRVFHAALGGIGVRAPDDEPVEHLTCGLAEEHAAGFPRSAWAAAALDAVIGHAGVVRLADLARHPGLACAPGGAPLGPFLGTALALPGRSRGAFYVARLAGAPAFTAHDEEVLRSFAALLQQGDLCEEARLLAQLQMLNRLAQAAAGSLELAPILQGALRELDRHLPLYTSAVWLVEEQDGVAEAAAAAPSAVVLAQVTAGGRDGESSLGLAAGARRPVEETPFRACVREAQAIYADWTRPEDRDNPLAAELFRRGATACFAVPLRAGDRAVGVLQCLCTRPGGFTSERIQLLYLVADVLASAVSSCRLYGRLRAAYEELRFTQTQLVQAEKMRALGELASGVAHEFNNSLCGVLGFLDLSLVSPDLGSDLRGHLEAARSCALDAAQVVRRVRDFARRRREDVPAPAWVDVNALVRQTLELARHKWEAAAQAERPPVAVAVCTEAAGGVSGSAVELREVVTNLVFNAVDAMPDGGTLTLRTWSTAERVFLAVSDTGVGIPDEVRHRLFEPFFTTKGERGSGLGLSVTFGIVQRHGGDVRVDSAPGQGTTFTVSFPAARGPQAPPTEAASPKPPAPAAKGLHVLVVEDEESVRRFLKLGLTHLGHRVDTAGDVRGGLAALAGGRFDLVLTDLGLPDGTGEEVVQAAARDAPGTPVVMLTGWAEQVRSEPPQGVAQVLGKPVTLDTLARTLTAVTR